MVPLLVVASLWYLFFTSLLTIGQYYIERHYARGSTRALPPTPCSASRHARFASPTHPAPALLETPLGRPH